MPDKILKIMLYIGTTALVALAFASIVSIFAFTEYNWTIACEAFLAILFAGLAHSIIDRII